MILALYCVLLIYAIIAFTKGSYKKFIITTFLIASNGIGILPEPLPLKTNDLFFVLCGYTLLYRRKSQQPSNKVSLLLKIIIWYYIFNCAWTIFLGIETVIYSLMVLRLELYLLIFFVFRSIPFKDVESAFEKIFYLSVIGGIFYYLQFVGVSGILQHNSDISMGIYSRLNNIPIYTDIMIYYLLITNQKIKYKYLYLLFFVSMVILSQNRGQLLTVCLCTIFILFYKRQTKRIFAVLSISAVAVYFFLPVILYRFSSEGSTGEGIVEEMGTAYEIFIKNRNLNYGEGASVIYSEGTGIYRTLLIKEKFDYMFQRPLNLFCGIGSIHEMSQSCIKLPFVMGNLWENGKIKKIDTSDVAFLSHFVRYGMIYLILFLTFIKASLTSLWSNRNHELFMCCFVFLLDRCLQSFNGDYFTGISFMFIPLLLISQTAKYDNKDTLQAL